MEISSLLCMTNRFCGGKSTAFFGLHGILRYFCGMKTIARIHTDFPTKFGIPRQSGIIPSLQGRIVFEPEYRIPEAVRGLEDFSHIWLLWEFSEAVRDSWSPTVRPPRLGGNVRKGVFATRSPFRPNNLGLSSVRIAHIDATVPYIDVLGADLMDGTPIYDIKPYVVYADSHPEARSGFVDQSEWQELKVEMPEEFSLQFTAEELSSLRQLLKLDPRPHYHDDASRIYGMPFAGRDIRFQVEGNTLKVLEVSDKR